MTSVRTAPTRVGAAAVLALFASTACAQDVAREGGAAAAVVPDEAAAALPHVVLDTSRGPIELALYAGRAPGSVANFLDYVDEGFYDGTVFHRVIEGFMIQGGGFDASLDKRETRAPIRNEADNGLGNRRYTIAMARTNAPHSATAQFFINVADNRNLDHTAPTPRGWGYTVFGEVVAGTEVVDAIAETPTGARGPFGRDVPLETVSIERAVRLDEDGAPTTDASASVSPGLAVPGAPAAAPTR